MAHRLSKITQVSLRDQVVNAIRDAIIEGKFKPGEKIPEQELATQLGVSRTPIREAIRILEQQGLVETRPKNGTYVARLNWNEVRDSLLVRASLEELAVRQALDRLDRTGWEAFCAELERLLDGMRAAIGRGDPFTATDLDMQWHTLLIDASGNRMLSSAWRLVGLPFLIWSPERELYPLAPEESRVAFTNRHQDLLDALHGRDPDTCGAAVRSHILRKLRDLSDGLPETRGATSDRVADAAGKEGGASISS